MKKLFLLMTLCCFLLVSAPTSFGGSFDSAFLWSLNFYDEDAGTSAFVMAASAKVDTADLDVWVDNVPNAADPDPLLQFSDWWDFPDWQYMHARSWGNPAPDSGEWENDPAGSGSRTYVFFIDEDEDGNLTPGETLTTWTVNDGEIQKMDLVQNVSVTGGEHPTVSWTAPASGRATLYTIYFTVPNVPGGNPNRDLLAFWRGTDTSFTLATDELVGYSTYWVSINAYDEDPWAVGAGTANASRYVTKHGAPASFDYAYLRSNNFLFADTGFTGFQMLAVAKVAPPYYDVYVQNVPGMAADVMLNPSEALWSFTQYQYLYAWNTVNPDPDGGEWENDPTGSGSRSYNFYIDEDNSGSLSSEDPEFSWTINDGDIEKMDFVQNPGIIGGAHPTVYWSAPESGSALFYIVSLREVIDDPWVNVGGRRLAISDRIYDDGSVMYSYTYTGNALEGLSAYGFSVSAIDGDPLILETANSSDVAAAYAVPESVPVDIKPGSCPNPLNVKSKGVLPVAILGTEDFDVTSIDPESVQLIVDVAPIRSSLADVGTPFEVFLGKEDCYEDCSEKGGDGVTDLVLKFDVQEVVAALEELGEVVDENCTVLELRAEDFDGEPIVGEDVIRILSKGN
jgi:hypothetical protein